MVLSIVIILLALGFFIGYRVGVVRIALSMFLGIVSLILVSLLTTPITNFIVNNTEIHNNISARLIETFATQGDNYLGDMVEELPLVQQITMIESSYLPEFLQDALLSDNNNEVYTELGVNGFYDYVGSYVANWIIKGIVFIIVFIGVFISMRVLATLFNILSMLPILYGANKLVGGSLGLLASFLIIWTMFLGIDIMYQKNWAQEAKQEIEESVVLTTIYSGNPLIKIIGT